MPLYSGNSAHYVDASIDTGEIIEVDRFPIDAETETAQSLTLSKEIRWMRHELSPLLRLLASGEDLIYAPASPEGIPARLLNAEGDDLPSGCDLPAELSVILWGLDDHIVRELRECPLFDSTTLLFPPITPSYLRLSHRRASYDLLAYLTDQLGI